MSYFSPTHLDAALQTIASNKVKVLAGGTDVYPAMESGGLKIPVLDVTRIADLQGIQRSDSEIRIGAATTWREMIDADLPPAFDGLKAAGREVGSVQIQNAATLAGNLCNASPAADGVPPLLTLNAEVEVASASSGIKRFPLSEFILGVRDTALASDQLMTAIIIPTPPGNAVSAFAKLGSRHYLVISIAMTAAMVTIEADVLTDIRLAVGSCSAVAKRLTVLESKLIGRSLNEISAHADDMVELSPIDDVRGTADYRRDVAAQLCVRAIKMACAK